MSMALLEPFLAQRSSRANFLVLMPTVRSADCCKNVGHLVNTRTITFANTWISFHLSRAAFLKLSLMRYFLEIWNNNAMFSYQLIQPRLIFQVFVYLYLQAYNTIFLKVYLANKNSSEAPTSGLSLSFSFFPFSPRSPVPVKASIEHQVLRESSIVFYNSFDIFLISESIPLIG